MGPRPVPWNHPASATVLPHSWWKSMSTSTETLGNTQKASCGFQTTFTVHHHFYAVSVSSFHGSAGVLIFTLAPKAVCSICVDRIQLRIVDVWKLPSQTKVAIIPTRIPSVISQIFLRFSGQGLSQRNISRIIGVPQGVIPKVLRHVCETSALSHILKLTSIFPPALGQNGSACRVISSNWPTVCLLVNIICLLMTLIYNTFFFHSDLSYPTLSYPIISQESCYCLACSLTRVKRKCPHGFFF